MQFIDLATQYSRIQPEVETAVLNVLRGGQYIMGAEVVTLEAALARFAGVAHVVSCASGTDALVMALMAKGVGPGDAVFTPPFTFVATAEAVRTVGATPVFVDIDEASFNIDPERLRLAIRALKERDSAIHPLPRLADAELAALTPRAVMAVDLFGLPADYDSINKIAAAEGMFVIEDAAQSFGALSGNRRAGSLAEIGCTSFFPAKPLGCYGDGGAIFTDDADLAELLRSIRVHGKGDDKYENVRQGLTGRLDTVQAAVLLEKLKIFEDELGERQRVAGTYATLIAEAGLKLTIPAVPEGMQSAWAQYSLMADSRDARDAMLARLKRAGIPTMIYYPKPLHLQIVYDDLGHAAGDFPVSEDACGRVFSVPMHPYLDDASIRAIVAAMAD